MLYMILSILIEVCTAWFSDLVHWKFHANSNLLDISIRKLASSLANSR